MQELLLRLPASLISAPWTRREGHIAYVKDAAASFYHDVQPASLVEAAVAHVVPNAHEVLTTETRHEGWKEFPGTYVLCSDDRVLPMAKMQKRLEDLSKGPHFELVDLDCGHSCMLSMPRETAEIVRRAAGGQVLYI